MKLITVILGFLKIAFWYPCTGLYGMYFLSWGKPFMSEIMWLAAAGICIKFGIKWAVLTCIIFPFAAWLILGIVIASLFAYFELKDRDRHKQKVKVWYAIYF